MGYVIASAYNRAVVCLSNDLSITFLPHTGSPPEENMNQIVALARRGNHLVRV